MRKFLGFWLVLFSCISVPGAWTQAVEAGAVVGFANGKPTGQKTDLDELYLHFFVYQQHLDLSAAAHEKQGKDGRWLSQHYQGELNFTEADLNVIRLAAAMVSEKKVELDAKAKTIVDATRAGWKAGTIPIGESPNRPALKLLDRDKAENLRQQITLMNDRLGAAKAMFLKTYLQTTFSDNAAATVATQAAYKTKTAAKGAK